MPFGIVRVLLDDEGRPNNLEYLYANPVMAHMTNNTSGELAGKRADNLWAIRDPMWFDYLYPAAYEGRAVEFESTSSLVDQFMHVTAIPLTHGCCGLFIDDVNDRMALAYPSLRNVNSGLFLYDTVADRLMLSDPARELTGMPEGAQPTLTELTHNLFREESHAALQQQIKALTEGKGRVLFEGKAANGTWLRLSVTHMGSSNQFALGVVEDITRMRTAEERSSRRLEIIDSISRENFALYLVHLDEDRIDPYRLRDGGNTRLCPITTEPTSYSEAIERYVNAYVAPEDRDYLHAQLSIATAKDHFAHDDDDYSLVYRRINGLEERYIEMRVVALPGEPDHAVLAVRNVHAETLDQIQQREALENALRAANHASQAKSTFLTNMSHDFRTPMNAVMGFANMALENLNDTARVQDCLEKILTSSRHLVGLVNDILDISRIESGKTVLELARMELPELMEASEALLSYRAQERGMDLQVTCDVAHPAVVADRKRLDRVFLNILSNAFKFTPDGGSVRFSLTELPHAPVGYGIYRFEVEDTGCGMVPEFMDKIFEPFERDGLGKGNRVEGTGLGMPIAKNLVNLMGGTIEVSSAVGEGTCFTVDIPLLLASCSIADHDERFDAQGSSEQISAAATVPASPSPKTNVKQGEGAEQGASLEPAKRFDGLHALVVDDDMFSREIMVDVLERNGFSTQTAEDGVEAVVTFSSSKPHTFDVVVMDLRMPRMDGDEAAREIRSLERADARTVPIVAATADAFEEGWRRAKEAGMNAHVTKPLNVPELLDVLAATTKRG